MKKFTYAVVICAILCTGLLAGYYFLYDATNDDLIPEPFPIDVVETKNTEDPAAESTASPVDIWKSLSPNTSQATPEPVVTSQPSEIKDSYPKVVSEDTNEVIIDFTDPNKGKTLPPDKDSSSLSDNATAHSAPKPAVTPKPDVTVTPKPSTTPKPVDSSPSSKDEKRPEGAVWDPVFGWVVPSKGITEPISSDKSIDEMVGSMGGD